MDDFRNRTRVAVSVIFPAYNAGASLKRCLKAVKASAFKDYELIVVDDGSRDSTPEIAKRYADEVFTHARNLGRSHARSNGIRRATGEILVFIDADVVIKPDALSKIVDYFKGHAETDALTGLLSKEHPNTDYFSQYKNLYMNYIFSRLPENVNFLFGSIFAIRRPS
ncbi:MAG TPA: glycosyltransferase family 2 protein, partial [bacterium]|nr:glycosyltransferase family 2 protein [bacterium]